MADRHSEQTRGLRTWSVIVRGVAIAYMAANAAVLLATVSTQLLPLPGSVFLILSGLGGAVMMLCLIGLIVAVPIWTYVAHTNLTAMRLPDLRYGPAWAAGSFFVPFVNFVAPFQAMRDLYNRSIGEPAHFSEQSVPDVNSWWTCLIAGGLIQQIMLGMILIQAVSNLYFTTPPIANLILGVFGMLLLSGSAFFLHRIVSTITRGQLSGLGLHQTFA